MARISNSFACFIIPEGADVTPVAGRVDPVSSSLAPWHRTAFLGIDTQVVLQVCHSPCLKPLHLLWREKVWIVQWPAILQMHKAAT